MREGGREKGEKGREREREGGKERKRERGREGKRKRERKHEKTIYHELHVRFYESNPSLNGTRFQISEN